MYGSGRQGSRSWLSDIFGLDPVGGVRPEAYGFEIERTDDGLRVEVPVAGFKPDEISVTVEDRQLTIEGRSERRRFTRTVVLPDEIDPERIDARVEHGMLTLRLPLHEKMKPRRIEIQVAGQEMKNVSGSSETGAGNVQSVSGDTQGNGSRTTQTPS